MKSKIIREKSREESFAVDPSRVTREFFLDVSLDRIIEKRLYQKLMEGSIY